MRKCGKLIDTHIIITAEKIVVFVDGINIFFKDL